MTRVKERSKLRQQIQRHKKALSINFKEFIEDAYIDPLAAILLIESIGELSGLQRKLNSISVKTDEKRILERAAKKVDGNR